MGVTEAELCDELRRLGLAQPVECSIEARGVGDTCAHVRFDKEAEAQAAIEAYMDVGVTAYAAYNAARYEAQGWTLAEQGAARAMAAHLARLKMPSTQLRRAQRWRPKLIDITKFDEPIAHQPTASPRDVLEKLKTSLLDAQFASGRERAVVRHLIQKLGRDLYSNAANRDISEARARVELEFDARITYLTRRFAKHAQRWQFAMWAALLVLFLATLIPELHETWLLSRRGAGADRDVIQIGDGTGSQTQVTGRVLNAPGASSVAPSPPPLNLTALLASVPELEPLQLESEHVIIAHASVAAVVIFVLSAYHRRTKPYPRRFQNSVALRLYYAAGLTILLGLASTYAPMLGSPALEGVIAGATAIVLCYAAVYSFLSFLHHHGWLEAFWRAAMDVWSQLFCRKLPPESVRQPVPPQPPPVAVPRPPSVSTVAAEAAAPGEVANPHSASTASWAREPLWSGPLPPPRRLAPMLEYERIMGEAARLTERARRAEALRLGHCTDSDRDDWRRDRESGSKEGPGKERAGRRALGDARWSSLHRETSIATPSASGKLAGRIGEDDDPLDSYRADLSCSRQDRSATSEHPGRQRQLLSAEDLAARQLELEAAWMFLEAEKLNPSDEFLRAEKLLSWEGLDRRALEREGLRDDGPLQASKDRPGRRVLSDAAKRALPLLVDARQKMLEAEWLLLHDAAARQTAVDAKIANAAVDSSDERAEFLFDGVTAASKDKPGRLPRSMLDGTHRGGHDPAGPQAEASPSNPAMGKFVDDLGDVDPSTPSTAAEALITLAYGDMSDFQRGLTGLLGPPEEGDAQAAMLAEHCTRPDSQEWFSVGNYGTTTTSEIEYAYVVNPTQAALEQLGLGDAGWPREARLVRAGPEFASCMRKPRPLSDFEVQRAEMDLRVRELTGGAFTREALIGGRLYTGPLFVKVRTSEPASEPGIGLPSRALLSTFPCLALPMLLL